MTIQQRRGLIHQVFEEISARTAGHVVRRRLIRLVMWRSGHGLVRKWRLAGPATINHQVAIAHSGVKLDLRTPQLRLDRFDEGPAFGVGDVSGCKVGEPAVANGDQVAADRPVVRSQRDPQAAASNGARPVKYSSGS